MPKFVNRELKKMKILHAAMQIFAKKGVMNTKMIDIAKSAGIGKGTIYEYFRSKEEIFSSAYIYFFSMTKTMVQDALSNEKNPLTQLRMVLKISLDAILNLGEEYADLMMDFWAEGIRTKNQDLLKTINLKGIYADYRKSIQQILEAGILRGVFKPMDTNSTASILIGAFDGILLQWIMDRKAINLRKAPTILLDGFIEGIRNRNNN